jgi:oligoribonuclease
MATKKSRKHLVWIDCEMTGLDPERESLIEIASIITDYDLKIIAHGPVLAIKAPAARLKGMDAWNRRTHGGSGLLARVKAEGVPLAEAERQTLNFIRKHCYAQTAPICGNSVGHDKRFIAKYMPKVYRFLNYRVIDVSTIKVLAKEWYGGKYPGPPKRELHVALADIEESIEELRYWRKTVFVKS